MTNKTNKIMTTDVLGISPSMLVSDTVPLMRKNQISSVLILEG
jgi:predicted transcriptional regulator